MNIGAKMVPIRTFGTQETGKDLILSAILMTYLTYIVSKVRKKKGKKLSISSMLAKSFGQMTSFKIRKDPLGWTGLILKGTTMERWSFL